MDKKDQGGREQVAAQYALQGFDAARVARLHAYFSAFAHLYGRIPLRKAMEIMGRRGEKIEEDRFVAFTDIARQEDDNDYVILGRDDLYGEDAPADPLAREIIAEYLLIDMDDYEAMKKKQGDKPYYMPSKIALLRYAEDDYYERDESFMALLDYLRYVLKLPNSEALADELKAHAAMDRTEASFILQDVERMGLKFKNQDEIARFLKMYGEMSRNTRMRENRGFTPREMDENKARQG